MTTARCASSTIAFPMRHLDALTDLQAASQSHPLAMHDAPADYLEQLARAVVGVEVESRDSIGSGRCHACARTKKESRRH